MNDFKKIEFSSGIFIMLNSMPENLQDSIFAALARVASKNFNTFKMKSLNTKDNSYFIRINEGYTIVFEVKSDTIIVTSILNDNLIKSYKESISIPHYEKI
jgi:mRNA-degrading endonuclease RelE of RelBE toxin-antitoxin system